MTVNPLRVCFAVVALAFAGVVCSQVPPVSAYTDPATIREDSLSLSPSGRHFALVVPTERSDILAVIERENNKPVARVVLQKDEVVSEYHWVSPELIVFQIGRKVPGSEVRGSTGELFSLNVKTGATSYLFGYRASGSGGSGTHIKRNLATDGSAYLLEDRLDESGALLIGIHYWASGPSGRLELARLNVKTTATRKLGVAIPVRNVTGVLVDAAGKLRAVSGEAASDGDVGTNSQLWWRNPETDAWLLTVDERRDGRIVYPLGRKGAALEFYVRVAEPGKPDYLGLLDPTSGAIKSVYQPQHANIGALLRKADGTDAYAIESFDGSGRGGYAFLDASARETQTMKALAAKFPGEITEITGFSDDGRYASVLVHGDVNPGEYYIHDSVTGALSVPFKVRPAIDPNQAAVVEPLVFKASDGLDVRAWLTVPNAMGQSMPLVVMPHGGPYGIVDRWEFNHEAQLLASRGYAVLQVNFRGSGGYGQDFLDAGVGEWGGKMISDIADGVKAALAKYPLDPSRICIYGISYGGYAALMGAVRDPDLYRCAIGFSGVYDLNTILSQTDANETNQNKAYWRQVLGDDPVWRAANSPTKHAGAIRAKVLLIHGGEDERTPAAQAEEMRRALVAAGNPPDWLYKPMEGHGYYDTANRREAYGRILEFLDRHIGPQAK